MRILITLLLAIMTLRSPSLNGSVTALYADGSRLWIGQGSTLIDAAISADTLSITRAVDLKRGAIRAIAAQNGVTFVLSEQGLTALDASDTPLDFAPGGGQRLVAHGNRLYVAALAAGVNVYTFDASRLTLRGHIATTGSAEDIAAEGVNDLWIAEGSAGITLYDLSNSATPAILFTSAAQQPAHLVQTQGTQLFLGYANHLAVFDTISIKAPRLRTDITLGGATALASDLILDQGRAFVGRVDLSGADVTVYDVSALGTLREIAHDGSSGSGDRIALSGGDLFVGSERIGLRRVQATGSTLTDMAHWDATDSEPCTDITPLNPQPANLSQIAPTTPITLSWSAACPAAHYAVQINGVQVAETDQPRYTFTPNKDVMTWQIIALNGSTRMPSAKWSFEIQRIGLITPPAAPHLESVLYVAPRIMINLQTPGALLALSCLAIAVGIAIIIGGAVLIGGWFERRRRVY